MSSVDFSMKKAANSAALQLIKLGLIPQNGGVALPSKSANGLKGADPNIGRTKDGDTPLDLASQRGHTKIADLLRKHGGKTGEELKAEGK
jgi:ankyrin repeat protein